MNTELSNYKATILIVDDNVGSLRLLSRILENQNFTTHTAQSGRLALDIVQEDLPDLILLDASMPFMDGFELSKRLKTNKSTENVPIIFISVLEESFNKVKAFQVGAADYLTKPFQAEELLVRINHQLTIARLQEKLLAQNRRLAKEIAERKFAEEKIKSFNMELEHRIQQNQEEMLERLSIVGEKRDDDTGEHTFRVGSMSAKIAVRVGLGEEQITMLKQAARLHDLGKVAVPDSILLKPGKLNKKEFTIMKRHTLVGAEMLAQSSTPTLRMAEEIALSHHERWDGGGYPHQLTGEEIPLIARIVAVADVFDALTSRRPYKEAWSIEKAVHEIKSCAGTQFDRRVVEGFLQIV